MLSDEVLEKVVERLTTRIEEVNTYVLKKIAESIKKIGTLSPSKAQELVQILRYGGDFDKIVKELAKATNLNVKDIYKIFEEVAKNDLNFAKNFYDYRGIKFIPYEQNSALKNQVDILANMTARTYTNFTNNSVVGLVSKVNGVKKFQPIGQAYTQLLDRAVFSISQGKEVFNEEVKRIVKELSESGLKTVEFQSGRTMRLDSAVRLHLNDSIRKLHIEEQKIIGEQFHADGVEISVHLKPAPDHEEVQGRQFSYEQFYNFQNDMTATSYNGIVFKPEHDGKDRRSIGEYNCYHYPFAIVLGVNRPQYSDSALAQIRKQNDLGFNLDGKHYTLYEGTQLQRQLELEIRKAKDGQIMSRTLDRDEDAQLYQKKINDLTAKYNELNNVSGLLPKKEKLSVSGYRPTKVKE